MAQKKPLPSYLLQQLQESIRLRGAISVADYQRLCLANPSLGYYSQRPGIFGHGGDFVTSPEMLSAFGELIGYWFADAAKQIEISSNVDLQAVNVRQKRRMVELGPGRGSLMADILRTLKGTPQFRPEYTTVELVETSPALRTVQASTIGVREDGQTKDGYSVTWHDKFSDIPLGEMNHLFAVAHEFLDALPVHQFQRTPKGWRERLVDVDDSLDAPAPFRFVLAPGPTPASEAFERGRNASQQDSNVLEGLVDESFLLHGGIKQAVTSVAAGDYASTTWKKDTKEMAAVEVCPDGENLVVALANQIAERGGAALIVDYGQDGPYEDSFQGIQNHAFVHPLKDPGQVDLSSYVNFAALREAVDRRFDGAVRVWGPVPQGVFLERLGLQALLARWAKGRSDEEIMPVAESYYRLVDPAEMGEKFKVMAIASPFIIPDGFDPEPPK